MDWIGKRVKIVLKDGFTKYGRLVRQDANFLEIEYDNGKGSEQVAVAEVVSVKLVW